MDGILSTSALDSSSFDSLILAADHIAIAENLSIPKSGWGDVNLGVSSFRICVLYANSLTGENENRYRFLAAPIIVPGCTRALINLVHVTNEGAYTDIDLIYNSQSGDKIALNSPTRNVSANLVVFVFE